MSKKTFKFLLCRYRHLFERDTTHLRKTISPAKRLAITLYFLAHSETYSEIAALFFIGSNTVGEIVHQTIDSLYAEVAQESIVFPVGPQLLRTMRRFEELSNLPMCCGAVDGTFTQITKPVLYGDRYWCYKGYTSILLLACVDSRGLFTYVDIGAPGSAGDAAVYNISQLKRNIDDKIWLNAPVWLCPDGTTIRPYLVGDSAFPLSTTLMRIFRDDGNLAPEQESFNWAQIRTRRVVECAFGRAKERFAVLSKCNSCDPQFASRAGMLSCALHNIIERRHSGYLPCLANYAPLPPAELLSSPAIDIRNCLARHVHNV
ncbi:uncharacterized protein LOC135821735 [Sycon ciliatum]|uniref:uncharacterized protein LOC135821735 n=1 Tax=Sycon ciliatum TaxID=27933 RepID=UPI0031F5F94B